MDGKLGTFLLGIIAAVVLVLLWDDKHRDGDGAPMMPYPFMPSQVPQSITPSGSGGCSGCGSSPFNAPSIPATPYAAPIYAANPTIQGMLESTGTDGMIPPPGVPLNSVAGGQGATSFYTNAGVTSDTSFGFAQVPRNTNPSAVGSPQQPGGLQGNVPGSPTVPANVTPVRATQQVPGFNVSGFHQHYNVLGVPLSVLQRKGYLLN